jgi:hypothetical protein
MQIDNPKYDVAISFLYQDLALAEALYNHYDMMVNNVCSPDMFRVALDFVGSDASCFVMNYYQPWLDRRR